MTVQYWHRHVPSLSAFLLVEKSSPDSPLSLSKSAGGSSVAMRQGFTNFKDNLHLPYGKDLLHASNIQHPLTVIYDEFIHMSNSWDETTPIYGKTPLLSY